MKFYKSIDDLPIFYWFKIFETNELTHLLIKGKLPQTQLTEIWNDIYNEFIIKFGVDEKFKEHFNLKKDIILLEIEYAQKKQAGVKFRLQLELKKLESLNPIQETKQDFHLLASSISKQMGYNVNLKTTSVTEFYSHIKLLKNGSEIKR